MAVEPHVTTNNMLLMIRTSLAGGSVTFGMEETFHPYIQSSEPATILDGWLLPCAHFYLYFLSRRSVTLKLRALIDHVREFRADSHIA